jgi:hypothetical protein
MKRADVEAWLALYERAWRMESTASLGDLFTVDAIYLQSPYAERLAGLAPIATMWKPSVRAPTRYSPWQAPSSRWTATSP